MEYRLKLRPDFGSSRSMSTSSSMSDGALYYPLSSMWHYEKPNRSLWDISLAQQVKFAMPIVPRFDAFGKSQSVLVGGFVGSKSQRPDKPDLFPIGNLISTCIQNHVEKSVISSQAQIMQAVMANLLLPEKNINGCKSPLVQTSSMNGCKAAQTPTIDGCKPLPVFDPTINGCMPQPSQSPTTEGCKSPPVQMPTINKLQPDHEPAIPLKNLIEEGSDTWAMKNVEIAADGTKVRVDVDSANYGNPAILQVKEPCEASKEDGWCDGNSCKQPCPQDLASSCKKMCQIASQCLGALLSDLSDGKEDVSQSTNEFNEIMNSCIDVIFPQPNGSTQEIPEFVGNCLDAILKETTPSIGKSDNHVEDLKNMPELAINAAMSLFSESGNAQLKNACMRLLSECSVDSDDSDFIVFDGGNCTSEEEEDEWTDSDCDDDDDEIIEDDPVREAEKKWIEFYGKSPPHSPTDVPRQIRFDSEPEIHVLRVWDFASRAARVGSWEQAARDRTRFAQRIQRSEAELSAILTPAHRTKIWNRMQEQMQLPSS